MTSEYHEGFSVRESTIYKDDRGKRAGEKELSRIEGVRVGKRERGLETKGRRDVRGSGRRLELVEREARNVPSF